MFCLVCAGNTEANKQVKVPEDHDSSSGTENPNKGKNDAKGVTDQVKEKQESSSEQQPEKEGERATPSLRLRRTEESPCSKRTALDIPGSVQRRSLCAGDLVPLNLSCSCKQGRVQEQ